jgi:glycosyltransferase involved in cell wall biosynthesis
VRVAFVSFEYPPFIIGGAGTYASSVTRELAQLGHEIVVFTPQITRENDESSRSDAVQIVPVHVTSALRFPALQFWLKLPHAIRHVEKDNPFDIIHFNGLCYSFVPRRVSKAPHVITIHHLVRDAIEHVNLSLISRTKDLSGETSFIVPHIEKRGVNSADTIIADSDYTRRRIMETYAIQSSKIQTVHLAIDVLESVFSEEQLDEIRSELAIPAVAVVLFVGRVDDRRKGLAQLLWAFKEVLKNQKACLLIVGSGKQADARKLAASLGIAQHVVFAGWVSEGTLRKCYALCSVYVCPSRLEGFGLTLLEAMAAAKPIVAANVGSIPEIMNELNGSLVDSGDVSALANSICRYLEDQALSKSIGAYNAREVRRRYDWQTTARGTEKVYRLVTSEY